MRQRHLYLLSPHSSSGVASLNFLFSMLNRQSLQHIRQSIVGSAALADAWEHLAQLSLDLDSDVVVLSERHLAEANESR
jgi:hypothetical protein